jgi:hypothetical protein
VKTLAEMEAAHKTEGLRLAQARKKQEALRAEEARLTEEKTTALHAELNARLQDLAAEEAAAVRDFAEKHETMARESQMVVQKQYTMQSATPPTSTAPVPARSLGGRFPLPPHMYPATRISRTPSSLVPRLHNSMYFIYLPRLNNGLQRCLGLSSSSIVISPLGAPCPGEDN